MAFVRRKRVSTWNREKGYKAYYYYLVENRRVHGKVRQKVVLYLGDSPTVEEAIRKTEHELESAWSCLDGMVIRSNDSGREEPTLTERLTYDSMMRRIARLESRLAAYQSYLAQSPSPGCYTPRLTADQRRLVQMAIEAKTDMTDDQIARYIGASVGAVTSFREKLRSGIAL
jgi:hypothetical protein